MLAYIPAPWIPRHPRPRLTWMRTKSHLLLANRVSSSCTVMERLSVGSGAQPGCLWLPIPIIYICIDYIGIYIYISIYIPIVLGWILMFGWLHDLSLVTHPCWCWCISSPGELQRTYPISYEVTRSITKYHEVWQSETFKHKRSCLHQLQHKLHPRTKPFTKNWRCILSASAAHGHVASGWRTPECSGSNGNSGGIRGRLVAIGIQGRVG